MGDHIINDLSCSLYKEELDSQNNGIKFVKDERHQIQFKEPFSKKDQYIVKESHSDFDEVNQGWTEENAQIQDSPFDISKDAVRHEYYYVDTVARQFDPYQRMKGSP